MKLSYWFVFFYCVLPALSSCSRSVSGPASNTTNTDTLPLPNTVDGVDTLKIMAYNVLNFGDGCQGTLTVMDAWFKTIVQYAQPDLLSCEKMNAFTPTPGAAGNLADEITNNVLNASFPGRYGYAAPSNLSNDNKMSVLFYNRQKLTYVKMWTLVMNISDFNLYKLYYNDVNLAITHDTTFLYAVVNHTKSGSPSTSRDQQVTQEMQALRTKFAYLPNLINMGDFNTSGSLETGYQSVVTSTDSATLMYDPPYYPDKILQYPGNWDVSPYLVASYLTTSTRLSASIPNTCGTSGGAKSWFDHIFISPWLVNGKNYMQYVPGSYKTIGNDGNRLGIDINSSSPVVNVSAPAPVIDALFQFSNKYPVTLKLLVKANRNAKSPADPAER